MYTNLVIHSKIALKIVKLYNFHVCKDAWNKYFLKVNFFPALSNQLNQTNTNVGYYY